MLTITEYLKEIFEKFEEHCNEGTVSMPELVSLGKVKQNDPHRKSDESSFYSNPTYLQLYLLKYAHEYGFEYLSMYNAFIKDFENKDEISVLSLGCGAMLDYWALAYVLEKKKLSRPVVKYLGIDAIKWNHSLEAEVRDKDKETFKFSQESFEHFFKRPDNEFNTYDVYFFPKSISEFSDEKKKCDEISDMEMLLNQLSETKKDTIYFCITLRKNKIVSNSDIGKVQKIIDKMTENGLRVEEVTCITDTQAAIDQLKENGLRVEHVEPILLGRKRRHKDKYVWETDILEDIGGYPEIPEDDPINGYILKLNTKCKHRSSEKGNPCKGCKYSCYLRKEQRMKKTKYVCDLILKFKRERG